MMVVCVYIECVLPLYSLHKAVEDFDVQLSAGGRSPQLVKAVESRLRKQIQELHLRCGKVCVWLLEVVAGCQRATAGCRCSLSPSPAPSPLSLLPSPYLSLLLCSWWTAPSPCLRWISANWKEPSTTPTEVCTSSVSVSATDHTASVRL